MMALLELDTEGVMAAEDSPLARELAYYNENREDLLERYAWKFVLIKGDRLVGSFDTQQAAYERGVAEFKLEPFMVRQVTPEDTPAQAPALYTGLVSLSQ